MLMTVAPHDLVSLCTECCTTLETLSAETGLLQEVLLAFAAGCLPLSARDRLNILSALCTHAPPRSDDDAPGRMRFTLPAAVQMPLDLGCGRRVVTEASYLRLVAEIKEEESISLGRSDH